MVAAHLTIARETDCIIYIRVHCVKHNNADVDEADGINKCNQRNRNFPHTKSYKKKKLDTL